MSYDGNFETVNQRDNFIKDIIETETLEGQSGNSILSYLRSNGVSIATSRFFELRREVLDIFKYQEQISVLGDNRIVPASYHSTIQGQPYASNFTYRADVTVRNKTTGEIAIEKWQISYNELTTVGDIKSEIAEIVTQSDKELIEVDLVAAMVNPGVF